MIFNGIDLSEYLTVNEIKGRGLVTHDIMTQDIPGRPGTRYIGKHRPPRVLEVSVTILASRAGGLRDIIDELNGILNVSEPVPIQFKDELKYTYYGIPEEVSEGYEFTYFHQDKIKIICTDPYKYGEEEFHFLDRYTRIPNEGTSETYPIFTFQVTEDTSLVSVSNLDNLTPSGDRRTIYIGEPFASGDTPVERKTLVLHDTMQSTSGWQGASDVDSGYVSGSFSTDSEGFYVDTWGDEGEDKPSGGDVWIGPSVQRALPNPLKSFIADIKIKNLNDRDNDGDDVGDSATGIFEVYLRDANMNMVSKFQFGDTFSNAKENVATFVTNGTRFQERNGSGWNNFDGIIRIVRDTGYYYPYIAVLDSNGRHVKSREFGRIIPLAVGSGAGSNEIRYIQVALRKPHSAKRMFQRIKEVKVWDYVGEFEYPDYSVPIDLKRGDVIRIDVEKSLVLLNGEPRNDLFGLETDFFSLIEGLNTIEVSENVSGSVTFRNKYI